MEKFIYICPICFTEMEATKPPSAVFVQCCGHYMVEKSHYEEQREAFLVARAYELGIISRQRAEASARKQLNLSSK